MKTCEVNERIYIRSSDENVFKAITDSEQLGKWWPRSAYSENKLNGKLIFFWFNDSMIETFFKTFIKDKEISFQFGNEFVKIQLETIEDKVEVSVCHSDIEIENNIDNLIHIAQTWTFLLINLKSFIEFDIDFREDR